jgi:integrase
MTGKLTEGAFRKALKAKAMVGDGRGLWLMPLGSNQIMYWYLRTSKLNGKPRAWSLGRGDDVGLGEARAKAAQFRKLIDEGIDPRLEQRRAKAGRQNAKTFQQAAAAFLDSNQGAWRGPRTYPEWKSLLERHCKPLNCLLCSDVDTPTIKALLAPIWRHNPRYANDLRGRVERVLDYSTAMGWRSGDNPARWRGNMKYLFALPKREVKHHGALDWRDVPAFMQRLNPLQVLDRCTAFCVLTASRATEAANCKWPEIDMDAAVWTIPATRMKSGREHKVPLSSAALSVVRLQLKERRKNNDHVFPGVGRRRHEGVRPSSLWTKCRKLGAPSIHGFRSAFREWAAANNLSRDAAELSLAHSVAGATERSYWRSNMFDQRREMLQSWARHCAGQPQLKVVA